MKKGRILANIPISWVLYIPNSEFIIIRNLVGLLAKFLAFIQAELRPVACNEVVGNLSFSLSK